MEYTKDMILGVRYNEVNRATKNKGKSRVLQAIRDHKIITATVLSAVVFISIDVVLITNFFRVLSLV